MTETNTNMDAKNTERHGIAIITCGEGQDKRTLGRLLEEARERGLEIQVQETEPTLRDVVLIRCDDRSGTITRPELQGLNDQLRRMDPKEMADILNGYANGNPRNRQERRRLEKGRKKRRRTQ